MSNFNDNEKKIIFGKALLDQGMNSGIFNVLFLVYLIEKTLVCKILNYCCSSNLIYRILNPSFNFCYYIIIMICMIQLPCSRIVFSIETITPFRSQPTIGRTIQSKVVYSRGPTTSKSTCFFICISILSCCIYFV